MRRPLILFGGILLVLGGMAAWEFPNYLRKPSLKTHAFEEDGCRIDLFFDGVRPRKTAVFFRGSGREILLDLLDDTGVSLNGRDFASLRWTQDRTALVATVLEGGEIETDKPLWMFDVGRLTPITDSQGDAIRLRGGLGDRIFSWFDLGKPGRHLFSWQAKRWRELVELRMKVVDG